MTAAGHHMANSTVSNIESGRRLVTVGDAVQFAAALGIPLLALVTTAPRILSSRPRTRHGADPAKMIAWLYGTYASHVAELSYEWAMRAVGEVVRRMTTANGRRVRDSWQLVTQVPARERQMVRMNHAHAQAMLAEIARQHGHRIVGPSG